MLGLSEDEWTQAWGAVTEAIRAYSAGDARPQIDRRPEPEAVRAYLAEIDLDRPLPATEAVRYVVEGLHRFQVHISNPTYMGRFNPAPSDMGVLADTLVAAFNPQLAAWIYASFPNEVEQLLVRELAQRLCGWDQHAETPAMSAALRRSRQSTSSWMFSTTTGTFQ